MTDAAKPKLSAEDEAALLQLQKLQAMFQQKQMAVQVASKVEAPPEPPKAAEKPPVEAPVEVEQVERVRLPPAMQEKEPKKIQIKLHPQTPPSQREASEMQLKLQQQKEQQRQQKEQQRQQKEQQQREQQQKEQQLLQQKQQEQQKQQQEQEQMMQKQQEQQSQPQPEQQQMQQQQQEQQNQQQQQMQQQQQTQQQQMQQQQMQQQQLQQQQMQQQQMQQQQMQQQQMQQQQQMDGQALMQQQMQHMMSQAYQMGMPHMQGNMQFGYQQGCDPMAAYCQGMMQPGCQGCQAGCCGSPSESLELKPAEAVEAAPLATAQPKAAPAPPSDAVATTAEGTKVEMEKDTEVEPPKEPESKEDLPSRPAEPTENNAAAAEGAPEAEKAPPAVLEAKPKPRSKWDQGPSEDVVTTSTPGPLTPGPVNQQQVEQQMTQQQQQQQMMEQQQMQQMQQQQMQQQQMQQQQMQQQQMQQQQMQQQQQMMQQQQMQQQQQLEYQQQLQMQAQQQQMMMGQVPQQGCMYGNQGDGCQMMGQFDYQQQLQQQQMQQQQMQAQQQMMMGQVPQQGYAQYGQGDACGCQMGMPQQCGYVQGVGMATMAASDPMAAYYAAGVAQPSGAYGGNMQMQQMQPMQQGGMYGCQGPGSDGKHYGTVKVVNAEKGFGFISCATMQNDVFFLRAELPVELQAEERNFIGKPVVFDLQMGKDGRPRANNVQSCAMELVHQAMQKTQGSIIEGTIKSYNERYGYGFISSHQLQRDAQFKTAELTVDLQAMGMTLIGRLVDCQVQTLPDGKFKATHIALKQGGGGCGGCCNGGCCNGCDSGGSQSSRVRGYIYNFDPNSRLGVISAPGVANEVHFYEGTGQNLPPGTEVTFVLQVLPDGSTQGVDVAVGAANMAMQSQDGGQVTGMVKVFNDARGYGFISSPQHQQDIYFQRRDMDEASQTLLNWVGGAGIQNCTAHLRVEGLPDGRLHGRMVNLAETGATLFDNAAVCGMIRAFTEEGGAINVPGAQGLDLRCSQSDLSGDLQKKLQEGGLAAMAGTTVWCRLSAVNGVWHAKEVTAAGDGTQKAAEGSKGFTTVAGKTLMKAEKKIIPGAELLGTMKAWNHEKGYGFIHVEGQQLDVYFQPWDLTDTLKQQFDTVGPEVCGISQGAVMHFWLQLMPGTGRFRGRNISVAPAGTPASDVNSVTEAIRAAQVVFEEEMAQHPGSVPPGPVAVASAPGGKRPVEPGTDEAAKRQKVDGDSVQPGQRLKGNVSSFASELGGTLSSPDVALPITFQKDQLPSGTESVQPGQSVEFELCVVGENQFAAKGLVLI